MAGISKTHTLMFDRHESIALIIGHLRSKRAIDRNLLVIHAQSIKMGILVGEKASLQHLVGTRLDARNHIGDVESCLFDFGEIVGRIAIQDDLAAWNQRVFLVRPYL